MATVLRQGDVTRQTQSNGGGLSRLRISLAYRWRHGRFPDLDNPRSFTEWVQWRKLNERSVMLARMTDKLASKALVESKLGPEWIVPTLWHGEEPPAHPPWPTPFVIKAAHGCNQYAVIHDVARDWPAARQAARRWMSQRYGGWLDEWLYSGNRPRLIVEPFLGPGTAPLIDYKLYVFAGHVEIIQVHLDRFADHHWVQYDCAWNRLSNGADASPPVGLEAMIAAAETLGDGHDFLRVDFYDLPDGPRFGEFCLYPGSGLDPFDPVELDRRLGDCWAAARAVLGRN